MIVIGVTGVIASGKSFITKCFEVLGAETFDADKEVHYLFESSDLVKRFINKEFPDAIVNEKIDRSKLGEIVYNDEKKLTKLESFIHPIIRERELDFIIFSRLKGKKAIVMDIPLLFETGFDEYCDYIVLASCPQFIIRQRAKKRGMNSKRLKKVLALQDDFNYKSKRSDFIVNTGLNKAYSFKQVRQIFKKLLAI